MVIPRLMINAGAQVVFLATVLLFVGGGTVRAQENDQARESDRVQLGGLAEGQRIIGGGLVFGEISGFTAKLWYVETGFALDSMVGWTIDGRTAFTIYGGGLFNIALIETANQRYIVPYIGLGVHWELSDDPSVQLRVPVGLAILPIRVLPIEFFAQITPGVGLLPDTDAQVGATIGARFYLPLASEA